MRKEILLGILVLMCCFGSLMSCETIKPYPKFFTDQSVVVTTGFYEGCIGKITGSDRNDTVSKDEFIYTIDLKRCPEHEFAPRILVGESVLRGI